MKFLLLTLLLLPSLVLGQTTGSQKKYDPPFNLLDNGNFEKKTSGWTNSGGTFAHVTSGSNLLFDKGSATFDASATSQYVQTKLYTVTEGLKGAKCMARIYYKGGDANLVLKALDGSSNLLGSTVLTALSATGPASVVFSCPSSGSLRLRVESTANAAIIALDNAHVGIADNLLQISQTQFVGSAYYATTAGCVWSVTSASYAPFTTTAACPAPTIEFSNLGTWQTVDADLPQITINGLPPGMYEVKVQGAFYQTAGSGTVSSFAITDGTTTSGVAESAFLSPSGIEGGQTLVGYFQYTDSGNRTFSMRGAASSSAANISVENFARLQFSLVRYPLATETVLAPSQVANSWSGYHASNCTWTTASATYVDPAGDASCTFTERTNTNFGSVVSADSAGNNIPGIVFTPSRAGKYNVCALVSGSGATAGQGYEFHLTDGSLEIAERTLTAPITGNYEQTVTLCGQYQANSVIPVTLKVQMKQAGADTTAINPNVLAKAVEWSIFQIDQSLPAPLLINTVVSPSSGIVQVLGAHITEAAGGSITRQTGSALTGVSCASSICTLTFAAATFSAPPMCTCSAYSTPLNMSCEFDKNTPITSTSVTVRTSIANTGNASGDIEFFLNCIGAK